MKSFNAKLRTILCVVAYIIPSISAQSFEFPIKPLIITTEYKGLILEIYEQAARKDLLAVLPLSFKEVAVRIAQDEPVSKQDFEQAITELLNELARAPRPDGIGCPPINGPVPPPDGCDLTTVNGLLARIINLIGSTDQTPCDETILGILGDACTILDNQSISQVLANIEQDVVSVFTALSDVHVVATATVDLSGVYTALNECCTNLSTEISGVFTALNNVTATVDLSGVFTALNDVTANVDLSGVFTAIANVTAVVDLSPVFTALEACCENITAEFQGTFTALNNVTATVDLSGVFTALNDVTANVDLSGVFTAIANVTAVVDLSPVFTALEACCENITAEFQGTFTALNNVTATVDLSGVFTALNDVTANVDLSGVFTAIANVTAVVDLSPVFTALEACCNNTSSGFISTFTAIESIQNSINSTFTVLSEIDREIQSTFTVLDTVIQDISGTFTALEACCENITAEFQGTFTAIQDLKNIVEQDFQGTFTAIDAISSTIDLSGVYTVLNTVIIDVDGTFTVLNKLDQEAQGTFTALEACCENITAEFQGTFTVLRTIQNDIEGLSLSSCCTCGMTYISSITAQPYVISQPGYYVLCESIAATGPTDIFVIASNGVTLDLNGQSLYSNGIAGTDAIFVGSFYNILIKNGNITGMPGNGMTLNASEITLDNITITNCTGHGVEAITIDGNILNSHFDLNFQNGFYANTDSVLYMYNSTMDENRGDGLAFVAHEDAVIEESEMNRNSGNGCSIDSSSRNVIMKKCDFIRNTGAGLTVAGDNNIAQNCTALQSLNGNGFEIVSGQTNSFNNCRSQANGNDGFYIDASASLALIQNCQAIANSVNGFENNSVTSLLVGNFAFGQGAAGNYAGTGPVGFILVGNGAQPGAGSFDERMIDNISVF